MNELSDNTQVVPEALPFRFYTIAQVCDMLGVSRWRIMADLKTGKLPSYKFGSLVRIRDDDLASYVAQAIVEPLEALVGPIRG